MHWLIIILILPYLFLLLKIYRNIFNAETFFSSADPVTFVSIIVACHNEEKNLPELMKSIEEQDYPNKLLEVVIVNDNSSDGTLKIASGYKGELNVKPINNKGKGKKSAIRTGIDISSGNFIITTDADCRMKKRWIRTIAAFFEKHRPDMIICPVTLKSEPGFFHRFQEIEFLSLQGVTAGSALGGEATMCNGANLAFTRKSYLDHSKNMHEEIDSGDDIFFLHSLKQDVKSVIKWLESTDAIVTAASSPTLPSFIKQRKRWISKGKVYHDIPTIVLAIVTFVTIIIQVSLIFAGLINPDFWFVFLAIFLIKSVPDYLIISNRSRNYERKNLMRWFIPAQIIYPGYILGVIFFSLFPGKKHVS